MIKLEQYRDLWLSEKMSEVIGFYPREFYPLDNFSSFKVEWNGYLYSTLEEAYQAASFMGSSEELVEKIKNSHSADEAQRIAYANRDKQRTDWNEVKVGIMEELLRLKIEQNPYVKKKLLETKDYIIVEDSPKDSFWGWGPNRDGNNQLGKLWMKLRAELIDKENI
ncbi:MAG: NADAR family protein [Clostridiales bacterium]|nr:NADAR family protein [Clostridiales bacterium]